MRVLYPYRVDLYDPVPTIYRRVGEELTHEVYGFVGQGSEVTRPLRINTIELGSRDSVKAIQYLRAYVDDFDLIHTGPTIHSPIAQIASKHNRTKVIHTIHNAEMGFADWGIWRELNRRIQVRSSDEVTAVSPYLKEFIRNEYGRSPVVIPNGVDLETFDARDDSNGRGGYLFVGRFVDKKNPSFVLDLAERLPETDFKLRGEGPQQTAIAERAQELANVTLLPRLSNEELSQEYAASKALLCPFEREGFGMVVIESLACDTPVVGLRSGNIPNLIQDGRNGLLCDALSLGEWTAAIQQINERNKGFRSRDSVRQFGWKNIAAKYEDLYNKIVR